MNRKYSTSMRANRTQNHSSSVMPETAVPLPASSDPNALKMRSQCSRCMNTATPPTTRETADTIRDAFCIFLPTPMSVSRPWTAMVPPHRLRKNVKRIRGHWSSMFYSLHFLGSRSRYMNLGLFPASAR